MQANDDYILLLSKRFSGELTAAEAVALQQWLDQSPENERFAAELNQVWEKTGAYSPAFSPDLDLAFRQLQSKIQAEQQPRVRVFPLGRQLVRIAAALAFLLAAVWVYREYSTPGSLKASAKNEDKLLVDLPDGSRVWLRQNGAMEYPAQFEGTERHVQLSGEAYFEVQHDPSHPFFVDLPNGDVVKVLGTAFGIRLSPNHMQTDVFVRSGKVLFTPKMQPEGVVLTAHQKATYNRKTTQLTVDQSATLNELAWQSGGLEFINTPMADVIADLEAHYNVKITLRNTTMRSCPHTALHTTQPIDKVLESLALTHQFRVSNPAPGQYELTGGNCQ